MRAVNKHITNKQNQNQAEEKKTFDWQIFSLYLILYSIMRFNIDFLRGDLQAVFPGLTVSQFISIGLCLAGLCLYLMNFRATQPASGRPRH